MSSTENRTQTDDPESTDGQTSHDAGGGGPEVLIAPDYRSSNPYQAALANGLETQGVDVRTRSGIGYLFPFSRLAAAEGVPDVFHIHFFTPYMIVGNDRLRKVGLGTPVTLVLGLFLLLDIAALRLRGAAVVWTVHDLVNHERRSVRTELFVKHVAVRYLFDRIIVHCETAGEEVRQVCGLPAGTAERFVVIPHGHFLAEYPNEIDSETARQRLDLAEDAVVFLFFGWIRPYKNVPRLVDHFRRLDSGRARLLVVGSARTETLANEVHTRSAGDDRIRTVLEYVPDEDVQVYMNAADAVVLPFRTDQRSLLTSGSVLLAMGFENAVVAPDVGCVGELLDEASGVCYGPDADAQPLTAMRSLLDADLEAMGDHNRRTVEQLDWNTIARRTRRIYEHTLSRRSQ